MTKRSCCSGVIAAVVLLVLAAVLLRTSGQWNRCLSNSKQLVLAALEYESDHGHLPTQAALVKDLLPYTKNRQVFHCPDSGRPDEVSYAMSKRWSGAKTADILDPASAILLYEVEDGNPVVRKRRSFERPGMSVAYADGHCRWTNEITREMIADGRDWPLALRNTRKHWSGLQPRPSTPSAAGRP